MVGLSMGGFATLHFGLAFPDRARSLLVAGVGYGAEKDQRERFRQEATLIAAKLEKEGMVAFAEAYAYGPTRVQFENKDPRGFAEFKGQLVEHSSKGAANTQLGVQRERPSIFDLEDKLKGLDVPTLILSGDEDWPCLLTGCVHEADHARRPLCSSFRTVATPSTSRSRRHSTRRSPISWAQVDAGRWPMRDPRAVSQSITGMTK